tara:strand:- start:281 stop:1138 length:858 start_codon:yes stop_codon:yes gene_type:complete
MSRSRDISKGSSRTEFIFTATGGQTTFATDDTSTALSYSVGKIDVYKQGLKLKPADFTATNGTSVVLGSGASADDIIIVVAYGTFQVADLGAALTSDLSLGANGITGSAIELDCSGDITLDADGADVLFKDAGTEFGRITNSSTDFVLQTAVSDKDFLLKGNDGGSTITALTVDMSAAGAATFNNDVTAFSDVILKDDINTIDNALDRVQGMRGVFFNRKDINGSRQTGVIAQEVEPFLPEVVRETKDEKKIKSVAYGNMVGVLIEAIKELNAKIEELQQNGDKK